MPTPKQTTFFAKKPVPKMPEGYYSGDQPNPNLRRFVEEHAAPYNPETDAYNVPPFDKPITATKATAIYNMHTYWSKKPHDAIRQYIRHYTQPGDLVLDPFCGSGGTALAALMEGRAAIAIDRSPAATFITKNYCTPVDGDELQAAFESLTEKVKPEMDWLYATRCDRCDGEATTAYTVYSYVFQCNRCLEKVPLFDCVEAEGQTVKGKPKKIKVCPHCYAKGQLEEISVRKNKRFDPIPVLVSYHCNEGCKPKRAQRRHNDPDEKKRAYFEKYDLAKIKEVERKSIPYWYPTNRMLNSSKDDKAWGMLWRPYHGDIVRVDQFFTHRNLWTIASLLANISKLDLSTEKKDVLTFIVQSCILNCTVMYRYRESGKGGIAMGTYYIPPMYQVMNAFQSFANKIGDIKRGFNEFSELLTHNVLISTQSALNIEQIPINSIDYIFTDPPYSWKVQYGESNHLWEAWMGFDTNWLNEEIIINTARGLDENSWKNRLQIALQECYRVLKPGRWLSLCYHDTSEGTWEFVQDMATEVGFIPEKTDHALYIDATQKSWKQIVAEKVTKRDLVINFRKPRPGELNQLTLFGDEDPATFAEKAKAILQEALRQHPGSPADRLYDELVSRMVRKGEFERHNFDQLLRAVAEPAAERWYLLATADQLDEAESAKEEAAAARLEAFMRAQVRTFEVAETSKVWPEGEGVHYSDLFEQYLPLSDKPRRLLQEWLPEFFFKTAAGTWRPPANEEERAQKAQLRASGALRRIKRFANALLNGVPPAKQDRPANPADAADWIRQCRRAGLYALGRALYEKGGFTFESLDEESLMEVEEDYQLCARRSG